MPKCKSSRRQLFSNEVDHHSLEGHLALLKLRCTIPLGLNCGMDASPNEFTPQSRFVSRIGERDVADLADLPAAQGVATWEAGAQNEASATAVSDADAESGDQSVHELVALSQPGRLRPAILVGVRFTR